MDSWWLLAGIAAALVTIALIWWPVRAASREARFAQARRDFHAHRERLEAKFIQLASAGAKPDSPRWADCDFDDDVVYVRNRTSGELSAFVAVTVALDALRNPPTSATDLISNLRVGTAVFRFDRGHWNTDGRAILNLSPSEAVRYYQTDLQLVDQEFAGRRGAAGASGR